MSWMNEVDSLLQQYRNTTTATSPPQSTQSDFSSVAQAAPSSAIAGGLAAAFRSAETPPFAHMVAQLFGQSNSSQRAGILNHLIQAAGPQALSGGLLSNLSRLLGATQTTVTPEQAQQVPADAVRELAEQAERRDPSIVERASEFYAQHPTLVQGLGAAALAIAMSHMSRHH